MADQAENIETTEEEAAAEKAAPVQQTESEYIESRFSERDAKKYGEMRKVVQSIADHFALTDADVEEIGYSQGVGIGFSKGVAASIQFTAKEQPGFIPEGFEPEAAVLRGPAEEHAVKFANMLNQALAQSGLPMKGDLASPDGNTVKIDLDELHSLLSKRAVADDLAEEVVTQYSKSVFVENAADIATQFVVSQQQEKKSARKQEAAQAKVTATAIQILKSEDSEAFVAENGQKDPQLIGAAQKVVSSAMTIAAGLASDDPAKVAEAEAMQEMIADNNPKFLEVLEAAKTKHAELKEQGYFEKQEAAQAAAEETALEMIKSGDPQAYYNEHNAEDPARFNKAADIATQALQVAATLISDNPLAKRQGEEVVAQLERQGDENSLKLIDAAKDYHLAEKEKATEADAPEAEAPEVDAAEEGKGGFTKRVAPGGDLARPEGPREVE